jgi:trehalose 6-phosphate phosphatase
VDGTHASPVNLEALRAREAAFFLDVDGTLLELAAKPNAVAVEADVLELLRILETRSGGAVALVSGRSIATLDILFQPLYLPAAGLHGFERRSAAGTYLRRPLPSGRSLDRARGQLRRIAARHPNVLLEDKRFVLALHYRNEPALEKSLVTEVERIADRLQADLQIQRGRLAIELRPRGASKATAISEFMQEAPFRGRRPVCLGDDLTDKSAFEWVNAAGGVSVAVGVERASAARLHLSTVEAAKAWLRELLREEGALP